MSETEVIGSVELEFVINNADFLNQLKTAQDNAQNTTTAMVGNFGNISTATAAAVNKQIVEITRLENELLILQGAVKKTFDPYQLSSYNKQIADVTSEISRLRHVQEDLITPVANIGKQGAASISEMGASVEDIVPKTGKFAAAIERVTNVGNIGARVVTQFSRQLIGLGTGLLSGLIGAKAIEALFTYISGLDIFTGRLDVAKQTLLAFNASELDANKAAAPQIANLEILYDKTQDLTKSMQERIAAAEALRTEFPAEFQNTSALAIVNGQAAASYRDLAKSILEVAESHAATSKINEAAGKILDAQTAISDAKTARDLALKNAQKLSNTVSHGAGAAAGGGAVSPQEEAINQANFAYNRVLAEQSGTITTQKQVVKNLEQYVTQISDGAKKLKDANSALGDQLQNFDNLISGAGKFQNKAQLDNIKGFLQTIIDNPLDQTKAKIDKAKVDLQKVEDLEKQYQVKATPSVDKDAESLKNKIQLLQQVAQAVENVNRKELSTDQQSLTAISDKFNDLKQKIANFNADPKNAKHQIGSGVINGLNAQEDTALTNQANLNENNYIQQDIDKKKKLYADYEAYRNKVGKDIADADYADLLLSGKNFQTYLDNQFKAIPASDTSGPMQQRRELIHKDQQQDLEEQNVQLHHLLESIKTYETEKEALTATYLDKRKILIDSGHAVEAAQLDEQYKEDLGKLSDQNFEKLTIVKQLFQGVTNLSAQKAQDLIDKVRYALEHADGLTKAEIEKILKYLGSAQLSIKNRIPEELLSVGTALATISKEFENINSNVSELIGGLGGILTSFGKVQKGLDQLQSDIKSGAPTTQDYINLVADGIEGITSLIGGLISASKARKQADEEYYNSVLAFQAAYNIALDEQVKLQYQTDGNIFLTNYSAQLTDAAKAYKAANDQYLQSLQALQAGQAIVGQKQVVNAKNVASSAGSGALTGAAVGALLGGGVLSIPAAAAGAIIGGIGGAIAGIFGGKSNANVLTPLLQQYPQLIDANNKFNESLAKTLIANNQVTAATKVLLQNTTNYYDEAQSAIDQINSALSSLAQNLGSNLESALVTAFENGTSAAQAFGDSVSAVISNIISQFLFEDIFGSKFTDLNNQLKATVLAGGSSADITKDFIDFFKQAGPLVTQFDQGLKAAQAAGATQGISLFQPTGSTGGSQTLSGQIQGITADQANILEGAIHGMQLAVVQSNSILIDNGKTMHDQLGEMRNQTFVQMKIEANTRRSADNSDLMVTSLKNIDSNTSSTNLTNALRAAGHV